MLAFTGSLGNVRAAFKSVGASVEQVFSTAKFVDFMDAVRGTLASGTAKDAVLGFFGSVRDTFELLGNAEAKKAQYEEDMAVFKGLCSKNGFSDDDFNRLTEVKNKLDAYTEALRSLLGKVAAVSQLVIKVSGGQGNADGKEVEPMEKQIGLLEGYKARYEDKRREYEAIKANNKQV